MVGIRRALLELHPNGDGIWRAVHECIERVAVTVSRSVVCGEKSAVLRVSGSHGSCLHASCGDSAVCDNAKDRGRGEQQTLFARSATAYDVGGIGVWIRESIGGLNKITRSGSEGVPVQRLLHVDCYLLIRIVEFSYLLCAIILKPAVWQLIVVSKGDVNGLFQCLLHVDVDKRIELLIINKQFQIQRNGSQHRAHPCVNIGIVAFCDGNIPVCRHHVAFAACCSLQVVECDVSDTHGLIAYLQHEILQVEVIGTIVVFVHADGCCLSRSRTIDGHDECFGVVIGAHAQ